MVVSPKKHTKKTKRRRRICLELLPAPSGDQAMPRTAPTFKLDPAIIPGQRSGSGSLTGSLTGLLRPGCIRKLPFDAFTVVLLNTDEHERSGQDGKMFYVGEERLLKSKTTNHSTLFSLETEVSIAAALTSNLYPTFRQNTSMLVIHIGIFGFVLTEQLFRSIG